jgi:phage/plasmid-associated DNA primase
MNSDPHLKYLLEISINGALCDIANVIYYLFKDEYVSARLKNKLWFKYDNIKWKQIEEGPYYELSTTILKYYEGYLKDLLNDEASLKSDMLVSESENDIEAMKQTWKSLHNDITKTNTIIDKLKNVNVKEAICKECLYLFYDPEFISKLDTNENLICFRNVVYDLRTKSVKVPLRSDMISIYIDKDYVVPVSEKDVLDMQDLVDKFISFKKNLLKKRQPKNVYHLSTF